MFGALVGGALALGGAIYAANKSSAAQDRTNWMNRQIARETNQMSYKQNLDFWNRQNAYNTPAAQMQRFRAAGLNPNLIYSQQNTAGPIASPAQPVPEYREPDRTALMLDYLQRYQDLKNSEAQEQLIQAQKNFAVQQAESSRLGNRLSVAANDRADAQFQLSKALGDASIRQTDANINFLQTRNALGRSDLDFYEERHPVASLFKKARGSARDTKKIWSQIGDYANKRGYLRTIGDLIGW